MLKKIGLLSASVVSVFALHTAELNINDKDLQVKANLDMGQFNDTIEPNTTYWGFSFLNANEEHSEDEYGNNIKTNGYYETSFLMKREVKKSGFLIGIGIKANYTDIDTLSFVSIPLGIEAGYRIPLTIPVVVGTKVYYAPESLAFSDADNYFEYGFDGSIEIIERGAIVIGFRNMDTNVKVNTVKHKINYNKSGYFGFRFAF